MNRPLVERGTREREKPSPFPFLAIFFPKQRACSQAILGVTGAQEDAIEIVSY